jgi:tripartite-type tricarboxylate transporter receptor subunit TctC
MNLEGMNMGLSRRKFLHLGAGAAALARSRVAWAQAYPSRNVRLVVGYAAGGGTDIIGRLAGLRLSERLGQQFIIENRPGATTNVGTEAVIRAPADGYTLLLATTSNAINATYFDKLAFNFIADTVPVAGIMRSPMILVVNPSSPAKTVAEFIAHAKANPRKLNMASAGAGGADHMCGELFKMMTGIEMTHVPYRGLAPALTDLMSGQVDVVFSSFPAAIEFVKGSQLRALAVTSAARFEGAPHIPSVSETVPSFDTSQWYGIVAPRDTPAEIVGRLNKEMNAALADASMKNKLFEFGGEALINTPAEFGKLVVEDTEKWGKVVRALNIRSP